MNLSDHSDKDIIQTKRLSQIHVPSVQLIEKELKLS